MQLGEINAFLFEQQIAFYDFTHLIRSLYDNGNREAELAHYFCFDPFCQTRGSRRRSLEDDVSTLNVGFYIAKSQLLKCLPKLIHLYELVSTKIDPAQ